MHAFESLTPDVVLDALASVGLFGDGRLQAIVSIGDVVKARLETLADERDHLINYVQQ